MRTFWARKDPEAARMKAQDRHAGAL
jgi:hypothetical protein